MLRTAYSMAWTVVLRKNTTLLPTVLTGFAAQCVSILSAVYRVYNHHMSDRAPQGPGSDTETSALTHVCVLQGFNVWTPNQNYLHLSLADWRAGESRLETWHFFELPSHTHTRTPCSHIQGRIIQSRVPAQESDLYLMNRVWTLPPWFLNML